MSPIEKTARRFQAENILVPCCIVGSLLVLLCPLPGPVMDFLLSVNIALGVVILLTTFFVNRPLEFSIFPTVLLATTLFRLVLNVATTRLILTRGAEYGDLAAGEVIKSFSEFVTGESLVVGMVIFAIFIVIQFVVITKGATRISEVAARFTLDAMPGRQMAIDADLNAGTITEEEARLRREELAEQGDFFGAMDGASKFVRGDAIAGVVITLVNIFGGLFIGIFQQSMSLEHALSVYSLLTIGDGLVSQVPALLISLATGILVTRSSRSKNLPQQIVRQMFLRPVVLVLSGCFLVLLVITGMPTLPLLTIGSVCFAVAFLVHRKKESRQVVIDEDEEDSNEKEPTGERIENYLLVDPMELEIGIGLLPLADPKEEGDLLDRIRQIRREVAAKLGFVLPKVRVRDSLNLDENQYRIKIRGDAVAMGMVYPEMYLAVDTGLTIEELPGLKTTDPALGLPAVWIPEREVERARDFGYTIVSPSGVIESHLAETARRAAAELLTRDAVAHLINDLKTTSPTVVEELIPGVLRLSEVQQVLQRLLRERVSIRQLGTILETLGDYAGRTKNVILLTEYVRERLARTICSQCRDTDGILHVILSAPELEEKIAAAMKIEDGEILVPLPPDMVENLESQLETMIGRITEMNHIPVLLVSPAIRPAIRQLTETAFRSLAVLSHKEVTSDTRVITEERISLP